MSSIITELRKKNKEQLVFPLNQIPDGMEADTFAKVYKKEQGL